MKKILFTLTAFLFASTIFAATTPSTITGTWNRKYSKSVTLYYIISGRIEPLATYNLQPDNQFSFALEPKTEGFYVVGDSEKPKNQQSKYTFYIKPGEHLAIAVNDSTYTLTGKNSPENVALTKWHDYVLYLEGKSLYWTAPWASRECGPSTYVDFFPLLETKLAGMKAYQTKTGNEKFDRMFANFRDLDMLRFAIMLTLTPRTAHPTKEEFPDYYSNIDPKKITATAFLMEYPFGSKMVMSVNYMYNKMHGDPGQPIATLDQEMALTVNDTLKGERVLDRLEAQKTYEGYLDMTSQYGKYILTADQKERENAILTKISANRPQSQTIDFAGTDVSGKKVALSELKGKVVYIDVWATWCGPCKGEIPHLKKLEEQYHGKDIVFLSISIDEVIDHQKWTDFVKKEELGGLQLFGGNGWESDVAKFYQIKAIPRFMLVDKAGNMVTSDAPRPSTSEVKTLIDKYLAQ